MSSDGAAGKQDDKKASQEQQQGEVLWDGPVNMRAPLIWQVYHLNKDEYVRWTHDPFYFQTEPKSPRMFHSSFLEFFTKTPWYLVPSFWVPMGCYLLYDASKTLNWAYILSIALLGYMAWSFLEYLFHRYLFHMDDSLADKGWVLTLHFVFHGMHHKVPLDKYRVLFPPHISYVVALMVRSLGRLLLPFLSHGEFQALSGGVVLGYTAYEMMHYAAHQSSFVLKLPHLSDMKRYHLKHHFNGSHNSGFGVTGTLWDTLFGTKLAAHKNE
eukprot:gb/GECG01003617.1/.p1 GENE.gb/GECG01003617.1/~~gb/GECG01003617.1/.p1  ORF type:complete len:269 (+),score=23.47 gb/GECG01003617.1/:1-807(+)